MLTMGSKNPYWVTIYSTIEKVFVPDSEMSEIHYNWAMFLVWSVPCIYICMRGMHKQLIDGSEDDLFAFYGHNENLGPNRVVPGFCQRAYERLKNWLYDVIFMEKEIDQIEAVEP